MAHVFTAAMAAAWLLLPYPYGLLLFVVGAAWHRSLYRPKQIGGRKLDPERLRRSRQIRDATLNSATFCGDGPSSILE